MFTRLVCSFTTLFKIAYSYKWNYLTLYEMGRNVLLSISQKVVV